MNGASVGGTYTGDVSKEGEGTFEIQGAKYDWELEGDKLTFGKKVGSYVLGVPFTRI